MTKNKLVYGVGVNDVLILNGRNADTRCKYYMKWVSMLQRCYSEVYQLKKPSYIGCSVAPEWLTFSVFKKWVKSQECDQWVSPLRSMHLDKDILIKGNKIYSPSTCVFVNDCVNNFINDSANSIGDLMVGVTAHKNGYVSQCSDPLKVNKRYLGLFKCEIEAHNAWKARKLSNAINLANSNLVTDSRVKQALMSRYSF